MRKNLSDMQSGHFPVGQAAIEDVEGLPKKGKLVFELENPEDNNAYEADIVYTDDVARNAPEQRTDIVSGKTHFRFHDKSDAAEFVGGLNSIGRAHYQLGVGLTKK